MKKASKILLVIVGIILLVGIIFYGYIYFTLNSIQVKEDSTVESKEELISKYPAEEGITHILLVGVDTRANDVTTRSDAMILLTLDTVHDNIKMTSFARDAYVNIPGIGYEKLTHAYAYGGMELLLQTIQSNFEVDVSKYVVIDFNSFIEVMDTIGGIEATLEEHDLWEFNRVSEENYRKFYDSHELPFESIDAPGTYTLNGYQTLAYVRMRKNDTAFARDDRQREVVEKVFKKTMSMPITLYPKLFKTVLPYVSTNIEPTQMIKLGTTAMGIGTDDIRQLEFPILDESTGCRVPGKGWVLQWDEESGVQTLHDFLNQ